MSRSHTGAAVEALAGIRRGESVLGLSEAELLDRFVARRDEPAFAALMARYGPLVMGVCRRGLDDESEVEDAFQATFLVLVRRAKDIRRAERLGPWLFSVARKVTARARQQARSRRPSPAEPDQLADPSPGVEDPAERSELKAIVDDEVSALPDTLRRPVVLCYLDGLTHDEAAVRLRWPVGTVRSRLARARTVLKTRLARRGIVAGASALALELAPSPVSASLIERTVRACLACTASPLAAKAAGTATASLLASGVLRTMLVFKWITLSTAALALGGTATISSLLIAAGPQGARDGANVAAASKGKSKPEPVTPEAIRDDNARVHQALSRKVEFTENEPTLEAFLKWLKASTQSDAFPAGVPIYLDLVGLAEAKVTPTVKVTPVVDPYPLESNIGFTLRGIGLSYYIKDGILLITSSAIAAERRFADLEARIDGLAASLKKNPENAKVDSPPPGQPRAASAPDNRYREINAAILEVLSRNIQLNGDRDLTVGSLVKQIRDVTRSKTFPEGIPIELDPVGFLDSGATPSSRVNLVANRLSLGPQLSRAVRHLGLRTSIRNGALWISTPERLAEKQLEFIQQQLQLLADAPGKQRAAEAPRDQANTDQNPEKQAETPASKRRESEPTARTIGDVLYIISADGRKIVAKNAGTGATHTVTIGKPGQDPPIRTQIVPVLGGRLLGVIMDGKGIDKLVAGDPRKLDAFPLPQPVEGVVAVEAVMGNSQSIYYRVGRRLYLGTYVIKAPREENGFEWVSHDVPEGLGELQSAEVVSTSVPIDPGAGQMMSVARQVLQFRCRKGVLNYDPYEKKWTTLDFDAILKEAK